MKIWKALIDYPCPICNSDNGLILNVHTSEIPYFGEHTEMTMICNECGWRHTDFIPSEGKKQASGHWFKIIHWSNDYQEL